MKHRKQLIFSLLLLFVGVAQAQVNEFNISAANNSIIRAVKGDSVLVYAEEAPDNAWFLLYREGDPTAKAFQLPPVYNLQVRDVRIHKGKTAYFCGTVGTGLYVYNFAMVGQFDIDDVFSGAGTMQWTFFPDWVGPDKNYCVSDLTRLDLYECHDMVCMAMTGKSLYNTVVPPLSGTTVASAWFEGSGWHLYAHTNRYLKIKFTDVACLEQMILAVGSSDYDTGCFVKPFHITPDFPGHPVVTNVMTGLGYSSSVGEVLVDQVSRDSAVLAHFDNSLGTSMVFHLLRMNVAGIPMLPVKTWMTLPMPTVVYGIGQRLLELNSVGGTAYLLHANEYPTTVYPFLSEWLLALDYNNYTLSPAPIVYTPLKIWRPLFGKIHSMDAGVVSMRMSGKNDSWLESYGPHSVLENQCLYADSVGPLYRTAGVYARDIEDDTVHCFREMILHEPKVFQVEVSTICEPKKKEQEQ